MSATASKFINGQEKVVVEYDRLEDLFVEVNKRILGGCHVERLLIRTKETLFGTRPVSYLAEIVKPT